MMSGGGSSQRLPVWGIHSSREAGSNSKSLTTSSRLREPAQQSCTVAQMQRWRFAKETPGGQAGRQGGRQAGGRAGRQARYHHIIYRPSLLPSLPSFPLPSLSI
jgi:hypothetical protein